MSVGVPENAGPLQAPCPIEGHRLVLDLHNRQEKFMPTELVFLGGILTVAAGCLIFVLIRRQKPTEPLHFR